MSIHIVGTTVVDLIFPRVTRLTAWPEHTEFTAANLSLLSEPPLVTIGGNGANAAYVAARCGAAVTFRTRLGRDALGGLARTWLESSGCTLDVVSEQDATAVNVTAANAKLQRATLFYSGRAPQPARPAGKFSCALVCGWPHPPPVVLAACLRGWRARGVRTALDVGPFLGTTPQLATLRPALTETELLLANEHEARALTRTTSLDLAIARLRGLCPGDIVIKCGERGVVWWPAGARTPITSRAEATRAVNTIGAGDTFNGALLAALDADREFPIALHYAQRAAASVVASPRGVLGLRPPAKLRKRRFPLGRNRRR